VVLFANPLLLRQWTGVVLVFLGLLLDVCYGKSSKLDVEKSKSNGLPPKQTSTV
jgi:hypothetical protein